MEITPTRPATELASITAATLQNARFKERRAREAESDVKNTVVYYSPVIRIDAETASAVIQFRDEKTGEIQREYPNIPQGLEAYKSAQGTAEAEVPEVAAFKKEGEEAPVEIKLVGPGTKGEDTPKQERVSTDA